MSRPDDGAAPDRIEVLSVDARLTPLVQHLRYRIMAGEMGYVMEGADARSRRLIAPTDGLGESLAVFVGDELAASVQLVTLTVPVMRQHFAGMGLEVLLDAHVPGHDGRALFILRLVSDARFRGASVMTPLLNAVFERFLAGHGRYAVIIATDLLRGFYEGMGFTVRAEGINMPPFGPHNLLVFDREDPRHMAGTTLAGWMFREAFAGER